MASMGSSGKYLAPWSLLPNTWPTCASKTSKTTTTATVAAEQGDNTIHTTPDWHLPSVILVFLVTVVDAGRSVGAQEILPRFISHGDGST